MLLERKYVPSNGGSYVDSLTNISALNVNMLTASDFDSPHLNSATTAGITTALPVLTPCSLNATALREQNTADVSSPMDLDASVSIAPGARVSMEVSLPSGPSAVSSDRDPPSQPTFDLPGTGPGLVNGLFAEQAGIDHDFDDWSKLLKKLWPALQSELDPEWNLCLARFIDFERCYGFEVHSIIHISK
jgi:hypothetical protein